MNIVFFCNDFSVATIVSTLYQSVVPALIKEKLVIINLRKIGYYKFSNVLPLIKTFNTWKA